MNTTEVVQNLGIPHRKLYYLEQKRYINPKKITAGDKEFRDYTDEDVEKIRHIWKYLKQGFKYKPAYNKALSDLKESVK